jgi:hypothetical protein
MTYLNENAKTRVWEPSDLLGVTANFSITLSKFNVQNMILGKRVSDNVDIGVNLVGTNKFQTFLIKLFIGRAVVKPPFVYYGITGVFNFFKSACNSSSVR